MKTISKFWVIEPEPGAEELEIPYLVPFGKSYIAQDNEGNFYHSKDGITWVPAIPFKSVEE